MAGNNQSTVSDDPFASLAGERRRAIVWFIAVLVIAVVLVVRLASIDRWMYDNNAETLDYVKYRENRLGSTSIASERNDSRSQGDYSSMVSEVTAQNSAR